jgi:hypothetical protein
MAVEIQTARDTAKVTRLAEIVDAGLAQIADALRTCWDDLQPYSHPCDCMDLESISPSSVAQLIKAAWLLIDDTRRHLAYDAGHPEVAATESVCSACREEQGQTTQGTIKTLDLGRLQAGAACLEAMPPMAPEQRLSHLASGGVVGAEEEDAGLLRSGSADLIVWAHRDLAPKTTTLTVVSNVVATAIPTDHGVTPEIARRTAPLACSDHLHDSECHADHRPSPFQGAHWAVFAHANVSEPKKRQRGQQPPDLLSSAARFASCAISGTSPKQAPTQSRSFCWNRVSAGASA